MNKQHRIIGIARRLSKRSISGSAHRTVTTALSANFSNNQALDSQTGLRRFASDDFVRYSSEDFRQKTALVVGSSGSLGRTLTKHLSQDLGVRVIGADVVEPEQKDEPYLKGGFVELPTSETTFEPAGLQDLTLALTDGLYQLLEEDNEEAQELDAVICVAGAWEGDPPMVESDSPKRLWLAEGAAAYAESIDTMMGKNLYPVLAAGYASQHYMTAGGNSGRDEYGEFVGGNNGGLFVAIGATAALGGTPGMLGYGLSKVATHQYLTTLGESTGKAVTTKSKRRETRTLRLSSDYLQRLSVVGILPTIIDTQANREAMPDANFDEWTKSIDIAKEIGLWLEEPSLRPHSGSLVKVHPRKGGGAEFRVAR